MEHGKTIGTTSKARFTFGLFLSIDQANAVIENPDPTDPVRYGATWRVDWRSLIPQDIPAGCKMRCTHSFFEQPSEIDVGGPIIESSYVTVTGLPGVQTFYPIKPGYANTGGSVINVARFKQTAWTDTSFAAAYVADESSFVCGVPSWASGDISLCFYNVTSGAADPGATPPVPAGLPNYTSVVEGIHVLRFEVVSDF